MCQSKIPLSNQRDREAKRFVEILVSHSVPPHGKFGEHEEGWGGSLIRNECDKLRGLEPIPRPFVVHVRYPNSDRLFTAWKGTTRSVNE